MKDYNFDDSGKNVNVTINHYHNNNGLNSANCISQYMHMSNMMKLISEKKNDMLIEDTTNRFQQNGIELVAPDTSFLAYREHDELPYAHICGIENDYNVEINSMNKKNGYIYLSVVPYTTIDLNDFMKNYKKIANNLSDKLSNIKIVSSFIFEFELLNDEKIIVGHHQTNYFSKFLSTYGSQKPYISFKSDVCEKVIMPLYKSFDEIEYIIDTSGIFKLTKNDDKYKLQFLE
ncbi:MAG: hypothetical protein ACRC5M_04710 [Anaeroplasmataceae bacterium]